MKIVSIDIETTGLNTEFHDIVELAAIAFDTSKPLVFDECPKLRVLVRHANLEEFSMSPFIATMHQALWPQFANDKYPKIYEENIVLALNAFIRSLGPDKAILAGKNAGGFDIPFLKEANKHCKMNTCGQGEDLHAHHRVLDPGSMYVTHNDKVPPSSEECLRRAGLEMTKAHTALGDAWDVARLIYRDLSLGGDVPKVVLPEQLEFAMQNSPVPLRDWEGKTGRNWW